MLQALMKIDHKALKNLCGHDFKRQLQFKDGPQNVGYSFEIDLEGVFII